MSKAKADILCPGCRHPAREVRGPIDVEIDRPPRQELSSCVPVGCVVGAMLLGDLQCHAWGARVGAVSVRSAKQEQPVAIDYFSLTLGVEQEVPLKVGWAGKYRKCECGRHIPIARGTPEHVVLSKVDDRPVYLLHGIWLALRQSALERVDWGRYRDILIDPVPVFLEGS
ncbi:MAG: hypothetical protein H6811_01585 [Phycisphaeraceae bacterium]|nr:hypothetical protein [Phycisphaeraceae bacterium]